MFQDKEYFLSLQEDIVQYLVMSPPQHAAGASGPSPQLAIKTSVDLPVYNSHQVNQKYTWKDDVSTKLYRVQDWLFET